MMQPQAQKTKKWRSGFVVLVAFFLLVVGLVWWAWSTQQGSDPQQTALAFYRAAWVEGNAEKAATYGAPGADVSALSGYVAQGANTPIMIAEYPNAGESFRMYYIYRPADNSMFAVQLTQYNGDWVVTKYDRKENYSLQMLNQAFPQLQNQWKEVTNP